jgi:IS30 family transposase
MDLARETPKRPSHRRALQNTSSMAVEGANEAITKIPGGFSPNAWVSNSVRRLSRSEPALVTWKLTSWLGKLTNRPCFVITDRATLLTRLKKVTSRQADLTEVAKENSLARVPKAFIKTLTLDNDKAFANHWSIAQKLDAEVYFTRPYTSQDKGTVENRIGVIRQFFPKGTDLREVSSQRI